MLLESTQQVRFNRVYFTIFRARVCTIDFSVDFVVGNSNKLQKLGLERKISSILNVFTFGPTSHATLVYHYNTNFIVIVIS